MNLRFFRRRVPFVAQMEAVECGAASLAMVLRYFSCEVPLAEVRAACRVSRDGLTALDIVEAAKSYGLNADAYRVEPEDFPLLDLPAILHWDFTHFLVLERLTADGAILRDPGYGMLHVRREDIHRRFTGVALTFSPGPEFRPRKSVSNAVPYFQAVRSHTADLLHVAMTSSALQVFAIALPVVMQLLVDSLIGPGTPTWRWMLAGVFVTAAAMQVIARTVRSVVVQNLQYVVDSKLMGDFVQHLVRLPLAFFSARRAGDLVQRVQGNTAVRDFLTSGTVTAAVDAWLILLYGVLLFYYSFKVAVVVIGVALLRALIITLLIGRTAQQKSAELVASGREWAAIWEALSALELIAATDAGYTMLRRWARECATRVGHTFSRRRVEIVMEHAVSMMDGVSLALILFVGGREVIAGSLTLGGLSAVVTVNAMFFAPLQSLARTAAHFTWFRVQVDRLADVLAVPAEQSGATSPEPLRGHVRLENVIVRYGSQEAVLDGISLEVPAGSSVGIIGPIGSGKSTIGRLLLALQHASEGRVLIDGRDVREWNVGQLRAQSGYAPQEVFLLQDTIRTNLSLYSPEATLEEVRAAARLAVIDNVIENLPAGYDTVLGQEGMNLSEGERQRLSIARAVLHRPALLLLDEPTSGLEPALAREVIRNILSLHCTTVIITHDRSLLEDVQSVVMVRGGGLVEVTAPVEGDGRGGTRPRLATPQ
jgi:ATP-binding cassette, subfamily B, bacterial